MNRLRFALLQFFSWLTAKFLKFFQKKTKDSNEKEIKIGDTVKWRGSLVENEKIFEWYRETYGMGPFVVMKIEERDLAIFFQDKDGVWLRKKERVFRLSGKSKSKRDNKKFMFFTMTDQIEKV